MLRRITLSVPKSDPIFYVTGGIPSRYALIYRSTIPSALHDFVELIIDAIVAKEFTKRSIDPIPEERIIVGERVGRILITYRNSGILL